MHGSTLSRLMDLLTDSGCRNHIAKEVASFTYMDKNFKAKVRLGNGNQVQVEEKGRYENNFILPQWQIFTIKRIKIQEIDKNVWKNGKNTNYNKKIVEKSSERSSNYPIWVLWQRSQFGLDFLV